MWKWALPCGVVLFLRLHKGPRRSDFSGTPFATNAIPEKMSTNGRGGGGENIQKLGSGGPIFAVFWPIFVFWALLLKNQSATTPSILGVRGSSLDSRKLSSIPFDNIPNQA